MIDEENERLQCIGCGAAIQTKDPNTAGYMPAAAFEKVQNEEDTAVYCQRCFRLRHYNDIQDIQLNHDDFHHLLTSIGEEEALILYVVDIFDFNGSLIPGLHRFIGDNPVLLVGNKADLLPKSLKRGKLTQWIREQAHLAGLRPLDVSLVSARKEADIESLLKLVEKHRKGRDVYVVGVTNVGKSTLINQIIHHAVGAEDVITTSHFPGTTLDKIGIPLDDGREIVDTPGIVHPQQMAHFLGAKDLRLIAPKKEIKPRVYQLNPEQSIFLGGLARFDFEQGKRQSFVVYGPNELKLHRTKLSNASEFYQKHVGELLQPPRPDETETFPELIRHQFSLKEKSDIVISGLGWITAGPGSVVSAWAPEGVDILRRKALI